MTGEGMEEDKLQGQFISPRQLEAQNNASTRHAAPVKFNNAPWQHNDNDFPEMATGSVAAAAPSVGAGKYQFTIF